MKNVYDEIRAFYDEYADFDLVIEQAVVESYLRKKAWQGCGDEELKNLWRDLSALFQYLNIVDIYSFAELTEQEYIGFARWLEQNGSGFLLTEDSARVLLDHLADFHRMLLAKKLVGSAAAIEGAKEAFFPQGSFVRPEEAPEEGPVLAELTEMLASREPVSEEAAEKLNYLLERLLNKIGIYYKNEMFSEDFNRAISLYSGPFNALPEEEGEDFWLGFWDFFLFDYHLAASDLTPLQYFYENCNSGLSLDEKHVLRDLLHARFTVFYIRRIINQYAVECVNLMTDERIQLPMPDYGMHDYKKVLLYGHIYSEGIVMLNYITSVPVSANLRKRIKEEIARQQRLFARQQEGAGLDEFFQRHAVLVRHVIDILVHLAKVNVGLPAAMQTLQSAGAPAAADDPVSRRLLKLAAKHNFSRFAEEILLRMWGDYQRLREGTTDAPLPSALAAAVFLSFSMINGMNFVRRRKILSAAGIPAAAFDCLCDELVRTLQLQIFDPRYLTEEGFVLSLYAF